MSEHEFEVPVRLNRTVVDVVLDGYLDELNQAIENARSVMRDTSLQRERLSERFARRVRVDEHGSTRALTRMLRTS